ncbi:expressed unknown protein [Seminavis robusta]|uniref:Uncharacterized protein n=1 Tax=Seminavis robusta TaxID=568900 RepID=A0A9N8F1Q4_9STRA|nr:expressed unknown protein [Seminavis robusta]|eukprot:Sro3369_g347310.1 n/a (127) ;mRNA; f:6645-7025
MLQTADPARADFLSQWKTRLEIMRHGRMGDLAAIDGDHQAIIRECNATIARGQLTILRNEKATVDATVQRIRNDVETLHALGSAFCRASTFFDKVMAAWFENKKTISELEEGFKEICKGPRTQLNY